MTALDPRVSRFQAALQIPTISSLQGEERAETFGKLHDLMKTSFPHLFALATIDKPHDQTLLVTILGSDKSLAPNVVIAHQDVVPVAGQTWKYDPFGATIADDQIIARGAIDDKGNLMATLEACEALLAAGKKPARTLILSLSDDEEITGAGAKACAQVVQDRYGKVDTIFDEGGFIMPAGFAPGVKQPAALVATGEKGFLTIELTAKGEAGHASIPKPNSAIDQLNAALLAVQSHPFKPTLTQPMRDFLLALAPFQGWKAPLFHAAAAGWKAALAVVFNGIPLLSPGLLGRPDTAAMVRVTTAPVALQAGNGANNVIPGEAKAVINMRLLPGVAVEDAVAHIKSLVGDKIAVATTGVVNAAPPPSRTDTAGFKAMTETMKKVYPDVVVVPFLSTGTTDSRMFAGIADNTYRCVGAKITNAQLASLHGANEAIGVQAYLDLVRFQTELIGSANAFA